MIRPQETTMPSYLASRHAVDRLLERFPSVARIAGSGLAAAKWLATTTSQARVAAQQTGMDLMLCLEVTVDGEAARIYLPVTPMGGGTWSIRTVLTESQARCNLAQGLQSRHERHQAAWRQRRLGRRAA